VRNQFHAPDLGGSEGFNVSHGRPARASPKCIMNAVAQSAILPFAATVNRLIIDYHTSAEKIYSTGYSTSS
jgi:hypothetical protein